MRLIILLVMTLCGVALLQPLAARGSTVELLPRVDPAVDAVSGIWTKFAGDILGDNRNTTAVLRLPYEPADEYDFEVHFTVLDIGKDGWICMLAPHQGRPGESANPNPTNEQTKLMGWSTDGGVRTHGPLFSKGKSYQLVLKVRRYSISQYLNGRLITQGKPQPGNRDEPPAHSYAGDRNLGISTLNAKIQINNISIHETGAPGAIVRLPAFGDVPSQKASLPIDKPNRLVDVLKLVNAPDCSVRGNWMSVDQGLVSPDHGDALLRLPYRPAPNEQYDMRVSFTRLSGVNDVSLILSDSSTPFTYATGAYGSTICGFATVNGKYANENDTMIRSPRLIVSKRKYKECICVRKSSVAVYIDGKLVTRITSELSGLSVPRECMLGGSLGLRTWDSKYLFDSIEVAEITGTGEVSPNGGPTLADEKPARDTDRATPSKRKSEETSHTKNAVAFAIAPDLLVTSAAAVKDATKISIETQDGTRMDLTLVPGKIADGLALLKLEDGHLPALALADDFSADAVSCLGFPTVSVFNSAAQTMSVTAGPAGDPWKVTFDSTPRIPGGPLLQNGKVIGVELCEKDSDPAAIPAVTLKSLKAMVGDSAKSDGAVTEPAKAVFLLTAETPDAH